MNVKTTLFSLDDFKNHEMPTLIKLHVTYLLLKNNLLSTNDDILNCENAIELYFINENIDTIEVAMLMKESDVFEFNEYGVICLN